MLRSGTKRKNNCSNHEAVVPAVGTLGSRKEVGKGRKAGMNEDRGVVTENTKLGSFQLSVLGQISLPL